MNSAALNILVGHAMATLPDSLKDRKVILTHILELIGSAHPLAIYIDEMLRWLEGQEKHQLQLALDFPKLATPMFKNDGDGEPK